MPAQNNDKLGTEASAKVKKLLALAIDSWDLLTTFDAASDRIKVFGRPYFSGGPRTKLAQLERISAPRGQPYSRIICLSAVRVPILVLRVLKWRGARILVNQNGVAYPLHYPVGHERLNRYFRALTRVADHLHFQSLFALKSFTRFVEPPRAAHSVLPNAVDLTRFSPSDRRREGRFSVVVFADIKPWNRALWIKVLEVIDQTRSAPFHWNLMGRILDPTFEAWLRGALRDKATDFTLNLGRADDQVAGLLRESDALLHLTYNDVCPNKVLEAMACGLPVVCVSAGGTAELVGDAGIVLPVPEGYERETYPESAEIVRALRTLQDHSHAWTAKAVARARRFSLNDWLARVQARGWGAAPR